jgi:ornithine carbamoyltransferase
MAAPAIRAASNDLGAPGPRHFLDIYQVSSLELRRIQDLARALKAGRGGSAATAMAGKTLAMIFEKPSTRTRVSFEVGAHQLGGTAVLLDPQTTQLSRGETMADTARVLSRYVDAIMMRTDSVNKLVELASHASVPVINGLTDESHPCQLMADVMTFEERRGAIEGRLIAWCGDGNNMACSWVHGAARFGYRLNLACPPALQPREAALDWARANGADVTLFDDPKDAVRGAECVIADAWVSMGDDEGERRDLLASFQVNEALMALADPGAIFMHCLPAHRGEEVTDAVIDGPQSAVWDEAENRLHVQKAILAWCLATN